MDENKIKIHKLHYWERGVESPYSSADLRWEWWAKHSLTGNVEDGQAHTRWGAIRQARRWLKQQTTPENEWEVVSDG